MNHAGYPRLQTLKLTMIGTANRPRLLVISHVLPYPGSSGQQRRVASTLLAARKNFHVSFLTFAPRHAVEESRESLSPFCDEAIVLESALRRNTAVRIAHKAAAKIYTACTGLKESNYSVGQVEFTRSRLERHVVPEDFDCVLYEYIHAAPSVPLFRDRGVPTVVDTHNVLWRTREKALSGRSRVPRFLRRRWLRQYRQSEERAWQEFDGIVAINRSEEAYIRQRAGAASHLFYVPMGVDLCRWSFDWRPAAPPRVGFYGGLGSRVNQDSLGRCLANILPELWKEFPALQFWVIGSDPSPRLQELADARIKVTGFVDHVEDILRSMSLVLCPWSGTYGFRSRLIEVMAVGVPVVASPEAVDGMELEHQQGVLLRNTDAALLSESKRLLSDSAWAKSQSALARQAVERLYSFENTYDRFVNELTLWLERRGLPETRSESLPSGISVAVNP